MSVKRFNQTDKDLLYYYVRKSGYTLETLGKEVGMSRVTLLNKANGKYAFTAKEIVAIAKTLGINDLNKVFFCDIG